MHDLVVTHPFGAYAVGQRIADPDAVAEILDGPNAPSVVRVAVLPTEESEAPESEAQEEPGVLAKLASVVGLGAGSFEHDAD